MAIIVSVFSNAGIGGVPSVARWLAATLGERRTIVLRTRRTTRRQRSIMRQLPTRERIILVTLDCTPKWSTAQSADAMARHPESRSALAVILSREATKGSLSIQGFYDSAET